MASRIWRQLKQLRNTLRHSVLPHDAIYTEAYYADDVEHAAVQSAGVMAKSIVAWAKPMSVIDVGCGTGSLLEMLSALGCSVYGLEYSEAGLNYCQRRGLMIEKFNIEKDGLKDAARYDVAVSFEVAEHLPARYADRYVALLCSLAPTVVISAATPGQSGRGHLNEQPHTYWINKFKSHGRSFEAEVSRRFSEDWRAGGASDWYCDNVMVFVRAAINASD